MNEDLNVQEMAMELMSLLRLKMTPIGIQVLEKEACLEYIPKCRVLKDGAYFTVCQLFGQAMNLGWTTAVTEKHIPFLNCKGINGMCPQGEEWHEGRGQVGTWYAEPEDGRERQKFTPYIPYGKYEAIVASPLSSGRIQPDVCMVVGVPAQMFILLSGYLRHDYHPLDTPIAGESNCSNHWVRTFLTGKPNMSLPCFAELRFGQYPEDSLIMTFTPKSLRKALDGVKELEKIGMRYPIPGYGLLFDTAKVFGK